MLRALLLGLLLANLAFFAWSAGYLGASDDGREPGRLRDQLQPERLRVAIVDAVARPVSAACRRIEPLLASAADQLKAEWEAKGIRVSVQAIEENVFVVMIPALSDKATAERKSIELGRLGIRDALVFPDHSPGPWAISLGAFRDEAAAHDHLGRILQRGVRSARTEIRTKSSGKVRMELLGDADLLAKLPVGLLPSSTAEVADCPAK